MRRLVLVAGIALPLFAWVSTIAGIVPAVLGGSLSLALGYAQLSALHGRRVSPRWIAPLVLVPPTIFVLMGWVKGW
jgi:hypothetical protein